MLTKIEIHTRLASFASYVTRLEFGPPLSEEEVADMDRQFEVLSGISQENWDANG